MDSADLFDPGLDAQARSGSELAALLAELARVVKARGFYTPGHPKLGDFFERGLRTWQGDLERHGDLEFDVTAGGFRSSGSHETLGHPQLGGLHHVFRARGVTRVRVENGIDGEAFAGLIETLTLDEARVKSEGGALRALYARVPIGIVLNGTPPEAMAPKGAAEAPGGDEAEEALFVEDAAAPQAGGPPATRAAPLADAAATFGPEPAPGAAGANGGAPAQAAEDDGLADLDHALESALEPGDDADAGPADEDAWGRTIEGLVPLDDATDPTDPFERAGAPAPQTRAPARDADAHASRAAEEIDAAAFDFESDEDGPAPPETVAEATDPGFAPATPRADVAGEDGEDTDPSDALLEDALGDFADAAPTRAADGPAAAPSPPPPATPADGTFGPATRAGEQSFELDDGSAEDVSDFGDGAPDRTHSDPAPAAAAPHPAEADTDPLGPDDEGDFSFVGDDAPGGGRESMDTSGDELGALPDDAPPEVDLEARGDLFGPAGAGGRTADDAEGLGGEAAASRTGSGAAPTPAKTRASRPAASAPATAADSIELTDLRETSASAAPAGGGAGVSFEELEAGPLERGVADAQSAELVDLLRELHDCDDTTQYVEVARRTVQLAERADEGGREQDAYRAMLVLAHHASQLGKRPTRQCEIAQEFLVSMAQGSRLEKLIDRACAPGPESSVRATQVLLQLGEAVVPALLGSAVLEKRPDRRGQMHGVLIAMGEKTLPELLHAMDADDPDLVRTAVRLAGETQNPGAVAKLADLLRHSDDKETREEAAKALVRVGTPRAVELLVRAIDDPRVGDVAIYCLGACGSARPVEPLVNAMRAAIDAGKLERAREIIRSLGRLGRSEAVPALAELLLRKAVLGRRKLREMKLAAAAALAGLPGDEAVGALAQAARARDPQLRRVAQTALDRRARSLARGSAAARA